MSDPYVPLKPIPLKERVSMIFVGRGQLDVQDGAFVVVDEVNGDRMHIPVGSVVCLLLEPGARISHAAVKLAATVGTLLIWVGEGGVRLYSAGQPGGARSDKLLYQARLALEEGLRLKVVRRMYALRFQEEPPSRRSVDQLRGIEGARVRKMYQNFARQYGINWKGRRYDPEQWDRSDSVNQCLSSATSCLYGVCEAAILAAGYAPAIGFLHTGKPRSFVYDIADIVKFETVVPVAFRIAAKGAANPEREVRIACRESFRKTKLLQKIIPLIEDVLSAGGIDPPPPAPEAQPPAIPEAQSLGEAGHRSK
ncbi:type I-E CRISPR-associated endonuclease Cas1e [Halorhodospira halochloris]|uniref:type I-E CRISPR-associated endonuclease Cas1e n=1 Tax=Halorhodospira halochloris TaxID=1052 RepID=UPI001EE91678|nr:type I-E CRISPR-associated endonuclease Cas1e [Halorhodospira halochloris]MCG5549535.1 type I-E CRISPR-associated endonuclease Cas1e [Halorhodospira halochloris]